MLQAHKYQILSIHDALLSYPELVKVLIDRGMSCVGCSVARFCTFLEAEKNYPLDKIEFRKQVFDCLDVPEYIGSTN